MAGRMGKRAQSDFLLWIILGVLAAAVIIGVILVLKGRETGTIGVIHDTAKGAFG